MQHAIQKTRNSTENAQQEMAHQAVNTASAWTTIATKKCLFVQAVLLENSMTADVIVIVIVIDSDW